MKIFSNLSSKFFGEAKKKVLVISGPTGSGKTSLSIKIAKLLDGEIINCDSIQLYKELNIGANKSIDESIPHHLFNIISITDSNIIGSGDFSKKARESINEIHSRNKVPVCVGGSGFFIQNLIYGAPLNQKSSLATKEKLVQELISEGVERLSKIDPEYAKTIRKNNYYMLARALEITENTGNPLIPYDKLKPHERNPAQLLELIFLIDLDYDFRNVVISMDRVELIKTIEERCEMIVENGLFEETASLMKLGFNENMTIAGIGYKQAIQLLKDDNEVDVPRFLEFLKQFKGASRQYSRTQFTWFRKQPSTFWIKNDTDCLYNMKRCFEMSSTEYLECCDSEENLAVKNSSFHIMPKDKKEKIRFYKSLDELYLYKDEKILQERIKKINNIKLKNFDI